MDRTTPPVSHAGLHVFRDPASVAVVGASSDPAKWGYWLAEGALAGEEVLGQAPRPCGFALAEGDVGQQDLHSARLGRQTRGPPVTPVAASAGSGTRRSWRRS